MKDLNFPMAKRLATSLNYDMPLCDPKIGFFRRKKELLNDTIFWYIEKKGNSTGANDFAREFVNSFVIPQENFCDRLVFKRFDNFISRRVDRTGKCMVVSADRLPNQTEINFALEMGVIMIVRYEISDDYDCVVTREDIDLFWKELNS